NTIRADRSHSGRLLRVWRERGRDREQRLLCSGRDPVAFSRPTEAGAEAVRMPDYGRFLARHNNELPNGLSTKRVQRLSSRSAAVKARLIGAAGTLISWAAFSSP